jgi:hypothetical protein
MEKLEAPAPEELEELLDRFEEALRDAREPVSAVAEEE